MGRTIGWATLLMVAWMAAGALLRPPPYDDTDDMLNGVRSQMALRTDHGTGCQYLVSEKGHITPRMDGAGRHVGCR